MNILKYLHLSPFRQTGFALLATGTVLTCALQPTAASTNLSTWVFPGASGRLLHQPDALGNRILDFTGVGYRGGSVPIPDVPVKVTVSPVAGDDGASIQAAINTVKGLPLDTNGFRGAVLLTAGEYQINGSILIDASGIVLRGAGDGTSGTILRATGTSQRSLIQVAGAGARVQTGFPTRNITNHYVPVGARSFEVDNPAGLAVGDQVLVFRPSPANWIADLGMDLLNNPWTPGSRNLNFDRVITRIEGNRVTLDAPLTCAIEAQYGGGTIRKYTWSGRLQNVGIEDIRGESDYAGATDEAHSWVFIQLNRVEHAWVRRVTSRYFAYACVALYADTKFATVADSRCLDPVSLIEGGRRYAFVIDDAQQCLVQNCYTLKDRHQFVTQSLTTGPHVFVDGWSDTAYSDAGPHHRWATGGLWDSVTVNGNNLNAQNRGNSGTGHGWAGANGVFWNSKANGFIVQNPPTARNWLIGSVGSIQNGTMWVGPHDPGTYDAHGAHVFPNSLYYAQLQDRLTAPNLDTREYWLGDMDHFQGGGATGEMVAVDPAWATAIEAKAAGGNVRGFDVIAANQWVPFTFNFTLVPSERLVGATLALSLRSANNGNTNKVLYLDSVTNTLSFGSLDWLPLASGTNASVRVLDLAAHLHRLTDGQLNLAVRNDVGIDWALLELHVAPLLNAYTNSLLPVADAYVRGGTYANDNYGSATTLVVKNDSSADWRRQSYLRWDLTGFNERVLHARVRLTPVSVGTNGLENGVTLSTSAAWAENSITWNNQPGGGKRFATWIPAVGQPVEFVITPQVQAALAGSGQLSLELFSLKNVGAPGSVSYASREYGNEEWRPRLILVFEPPATNLPPTLAAIPSLLVPVNRPVAPVPLLIGDENVDGVQVNVSASNPALFPPGSLTIAGAGAARQLLLTPASNVTDSATITLQAVDQFGLFAYQSFSFTVTAPIYYSPNSGGAWNASWSSANTAWSSSETSHVAAAQTAADALVFSVPFLWSTNAGKTVTMSAGSTRDANSLEFRNNVTILRQNGGQAGSRMSIGAGGLTVASTQNSGVRIGRNNLTLNSDYLPVYLTASQVWNNDSSYLLDIRDGIAPSATDAGTTTLIVGGSTGGDIVFYGGPRTFEAASGTGTVTGEGLRDNGAQKLALTKNGGNTLTLESRHIYTGPTTINEGVLRVEGSIVGGNVEVFGGSLSGSGSISVPVEIRPGGTLSPGDGLGTFSISNTLTLESGSTTFVEVNAETLAHDLVPGITSATYGGQLVVSNLAGAFAAGQSFALFGAATSEGDFESITPPPGGNLAWQFNPATGILAVIATEVTPPAFTQLALENDGRFSMTGTGPTNQSYRIFATTNVALSINDWPVIATGVFSGGTFSFTDSQSTNHPQRFYRISVP